MPTTESGKAISRRNALRHGLTPSSSLLPPDLEAELPDRMAPWIERYAHLTHPDAPHRIRELAIARLRIEQCQADLAAAAAAGPRRDPLLIANDDRLAADTLFGRLPSDPARTVGRLKQSPAGVALLLAAWSDLAEQLRAGMTLSYDHFQLALHLLGVQPHETLVDPRVRALSAAATTLLDLDHTGRITPEQSAHAIQSLRALFAAQVESLSAYAAALARERAERDALADAGHALDPSPQVRTLRRYESANRRIYEQSLEKLEALAAAQARPEPQGKAGFVAEAEAEADTSSPPAGPGEVACPTVETARQAAAVPAVRTPATPPAPPETLPPSSFGSPADARPASTPADLLLAPFEPGRLPSNVHTS